MGERERFHPGLFLAAMKRLDAKADGLDREGTPARIAAGHFDALVEAIEGEADATLLLGEQDKAAEPAPEPVAMPPSRSPEEDRLAKIRALRVGRAMIDQMEPEDIDISDLDLDRVEEWDDLQWYRAECSGLLEEIGYYDEYEDEELGAEEDEPEYTYEHEAAEERREKDVEEGAVLEFKSMPGVRDCARDIVAARSSRPRGPHGFPL